MKKLLILPLLILSACNNGNMEVSKSNFVLPEELKDCKLITISDDIRYIHVMRCPNSVTSLTYPQGKTTAHSITIDGTTYVPKGKN